MKQLSDVTSGGMGVDLTVFVLQSLVNEVSCRFKVLTKVKVV